MFITAKIAAAIVASVTALLVAVPAEHYPSRIEAVGKWTPPVVSGIYVAPTEDRAAVQAAIVEAAKADETAEVVPCAELADLEAEHTKMADAAETKGKDVSELLADDEDQDAAEFRMSWNSTQQLILQCQRGISPE